ncbi:DUF3560 domain-containing protein [Xanthomonas citri pv. eucalyptorum]|nr:DUF3560 domain-containing protein [Xanthomonas axonopodis pv. eucalyptorum]
MCDSNTNQTINSEENAPMNSYEAKLEARRERLLARAQEASKNADNLHKKARSMAGVIPFGQPILVGHHSESRDRNYRERIHKTFGKAFAEMDNAKHYASKAAAVGTGGISSDDPDAVAKLRKELEALEAAQERMKAANKVIRTKKTPEEREAALISQGFAAAVAADILKPDFCGRVGFPSYALSNNTANMRRVRLRIDELEKRKASADVERRGDGFTYREDVAENRVMFLFDAKPDQATRTLLKRYGFKWSPSRDGQPWVRQLNNAGIYNGRQVFDALNSTNIGDT